MKNLMWICGFSIMLTSCLVRQSKYDELSEKYKTLKESVDKMQPDSVEISGSWIRLRPSGDQLTDYIADRDISEPISIKEGSLKILLHKMKLELLDNSELDGSFDLNKHMYGFNFSLTELQEYIDNLPKEADGVRIYTVDNWFPEGRAIVSDILLTPIKDGRNLYRELDPDEPPFLNKTFEELIAELVETQKRVEEEAPVFNKSAPCPTACP